MSNNIIKILVALGIVGWIPLIAEIVSTPEQITRAKNNNHKPADDAISKALHDLYDTRLAIAYGAIATLKNIAATNPERVQDIVEGCAAFVRDPRHVPDQSGRASQVVQKAVNIMGAVKPAAMRIDLSGANLAKIHINKGNFANITCKKCNLSEAVVAEGTSFKGSDFSNANIARATLKNVDFSRASLSNAMLQGANMFGVDLSRTNLTNVNMNSEKTNLKRANLSYAILKGADMRNVSLVNANLSFATLSGVDFTFADLSDASLVHIARMENANFLRANLEGTDFSGSKLARVKNFTQEQLNVAIGDSKTLWPQELVKMERQGGDF